MDNPDRKARSRQAVSGLGLRSGAIQTGAAGANFPFIPQLLPCLLVHRRPRWIQACHPVRLPGGLMIRGYRPWGSTRPHVMERVVTVKRWTGPRPRKSFHWVGGWRSGSYRVPAGTVRGNRVGGPGSEAMLLTHGLYPFSGCRREQGWTE